MERKSRLKTELELLSNGLIENIIITPDKEILKEVEEEYGDPLYEANIFRSILGKVLKKLRKL
jgi:hypothetical protein